MKTTETVRKLLQERGHAVVDEVSDELYARLLADVHASDYLDVLSDMQEQELALYMAATTPVAVPVKRVQVRPRLQKLNREASIMAPLCNVMWQAAVVLLMLVLCFKGC